MIALEHWSIGPLSIALLAVAALHEYGLRRVEGQGGDGRTARDRRRQSRLLRVGLLWGVVTLVSPLGYWSRTLLFARAALDLDFAFVVAPLVALSGPWRALGAAVAAPFGRSPRDGLAPRPKGRPAPGGAVVGLGAFLGLFLLWHVPAVLDASVHSRLLWTVQILCCIGGGTMLWLQLVGSHPFEPAWGPVRRVGVLAGALFATWITGVALVLAQRPFYPAFAGGPGTPLSRVMDQGLAGAITWVLPAIPLGIAAFWEFMEWIKRDEDDARLEELLALNRAAFRPRPDVGTR